MMTPRLPTWLKTAGSPMVREISPSEAAANLRLRWAGLGIHLPLLAVVFLSWGFAPYFYAWAATLLLYLLGNHGLSVAIRRGNSPQVFASLLIALDFFLISALLAIAGVAVGAYGLARRGLECVAEAHDPVLEEGWNDSGGLEPLYG